MNPTSNTYFKAWAGTHAASIVHRTTTSADDALGSGSYGKVVIGHHTKTHKKVAVKVFHESTAESVQRELLIMERIAELSDMFGPVLPVVAKGDRPPVTWAVFPVHGVSFSHLLRHHQAPALRDDCTGGRIAAQLLEGLHALHSAGVLHLDLKPSNISVSRGAFAMKAVERVATDLLTSRSTVHSRGNAPSNERRKRSVVAARAPPHPPRREAAHP